MHSRFEQNENLQAKDIPADKRSGAQFARVWWYRLPAKSSLRIRHIPTLRVKRQDK